MSDQLTRSEPLARATDTAGVPPTREAAHQRFRWRGIAIRLFILLLAGCLVAVVALQFDWWVGAGRWQTTNDAYLTADLTPLAAKVPGYVRRVVVHDFQKVKAGDLLVEVVDDDYRAQLAQAEGNVASAQATAETIVRQKQLQVASIAEAEATIHASEADLTRYHLETVRQEALLETGIAGTHQIVEQAVDNEQRAAATLAVNRAKLSQQVEQLNVLDSQERQANATITVQQAAADLARINLGYTRIVAPVDGMVGQRQVQEGQYVSAGTQVISLVPLPNIWVIANYKETQMTRVRLGQPARVTVDAFPGAVLKGHVDSWSPASGAQFSLLPPDNATGNFTKVVQRIPVKIVLDPDAAVDDLLRPGMSVVPTIDTK
jgi:membrane fusion protein (multidrug efflux system)